MTETLTVKLETCEHIDSIAEILEEIEEIDGVNEWLSMKRNKNGGGRS